MKRWLKKFFKHREKPDKKRIEIERQLESALIGLGELDSELILDEWTDPGYHQKKGNKDDNSK